ncbi:ABC transporter ATP-binding protein [Fructobacillus durionis]|uniref:Energy-coupling factor transport system ATP-binding protein n=1 Tax=Fructobacillus durionis TaxID=283737 RepID=A0A1I1H1G5_9LACO|nr:ABC transporter ATP-binding protein [Fructobacillus durionis]SFC17595.1 energy-coupling factor transport system ATP-binding protein [Fructobacillus durionis]
MADSALQFDNVTFRYETQAEPTLKNINFTIKTGSKTLVLGPSGSGKSTLISLINALVTEENGDLSGRVLINDVDQSGKDPFDRSLLVGTILQDTDRQFVGLTVAEDIAFVLENEGEPLSKLRQAVTDVAKRFGLTELLPLGPNVLSGGQKQRVALAGVLVGDSPILVLDEPLASLDPKAGQSLLETMDQLHQEGITVIMVEHRIDEVLRKGVDQVLVLEEGELVFDGGADELLVQPDFHDWQLAQPAYVSLIEKSGYALDDLTDISDLVKVDGPKLADKLSDFLAVHPTVKAEESFGSTALEATGIDYQYGERQVLKDIDFSVQKKEWLALIGENGSGKSTLARLLAGFLPIQAGLVKANGKDDKAVELNGLPLAEHAQYVGYVSQNPNEMLIGLSVFEEVAAGLRLRNVSEETINEKVLVALKEANLYPYRNWPSQALSFGQKRRLSVLAVAILEPAVLILDEPTAGQDDISAKGLLTYLQSLRDKGLALVTVTHDMALIEKWSDRVVSLVNGRITSQTSPKTLFESTDLLSETSLIQPSDQVLLERLGLKGKGASHE